MTQKADICALTQSEKSPTVQRVDDQAEQVNRIHKQVGKQAVKWMDAYIHE